MVSPCFLYTEFLLAEKAVYTDFPDTCFNLENILRDWKSSVVTCLLIDQYATETDSHALALLIKLMGNHYKSYSILLQGLEEDNK